MTPGTVLNNQYNRNLDGACIQRFGWRETRKSVSEKKLRFASQICASGKNSYVSIKILADTFSLLYLWCKFWPGFRSTSLQHPLLHELDMLSCVCDRAPDHDGSNHIIRLHDHFHATSPNGAHLCLVSDVLSESIEHLASRYNGGLMPIPFVNRTAPQALHALDYLHTTCGIIHTGE